AHNDTTNSYDYFSHVILFLKENTDKKEFQLDVEELSLNKLDVGQTVLSEILDNLHKSQYELVSNILRDFIEKPNLEAQQKYSDRSRTRFTLAIIRALQETTGKIEDRATSCLQLIVDNLGTRTLNDNGNFIQENAKYNEIVDILKEPKKKLQKRNVKRRKGY